MKEISIIFCSIVLPLLFIIGFLTSVVIKAQKDVNDLNDVKNADNYIEVFEYSGHEYLRYKISNGKVGGLCHKEDCKFCKDLK